MSDSRGTEADTHEEIEDEGHEQEDEGAEESDVVEDDDGAEGEDAEEGGRHEEAGEEGEGEVTQRRRSASDVIREQKRRAKDAEAREAEQGRRLEEIERRAREAERRAEEAERRANERNARESEAAEQARVELMTEGEKIAYYRQKDKQDYEQKLQGVQFQIWDSTDRQEFRSLCREDPVVAKVRDKVEAEYERLKAAGRPVSRELIANQEIAKMVRANGGAAATRQRKRADESVRRETVRAPRARSSESGNRTSRRANEDTPAARRKRLEGVTI